MCIDSLDAPVFEIVVQEEYLCALRISQDRLQCPFLESFFAGVQMYRCKYRASQLAQKEEGID
jgi:hypothetical protein